MANVNLYPVTKFSLNLCFTVNYLYTKSRSLTLEDSQLFHFWTVFSCSFSILRHSQLELMFAFCHKCHSKSVNYQIYWFTYIVSEISSGVKGFCTCTVIEVSIYNQLIPYLVLNKQVGCVRVGIKLNIIKKKCYQLSFPSQLNCTWAKILSTLRSRVDLIKS